MAKAKPRNTDDSVDSPPHEDEDLIKIAKKRFKRCAEIDDPWHARFIEDYKFANADSRNMWQWPQALRDSRGYGTNDERPCLTINKTRQHCLQIINDSRQNKAAIRVRPAGDESTYEAALIYEGCVRHIEYISDAQTCYTNAVRFQVMGGLGYVRVITQYVSDDSFDQEIYIRPVIDPLTVYMDPDAKEEDGSDANFAFLFEDIERDDFKRLYPKVELAAINSVLGAGDDQWIGKDRVRIAEYYYREDAPDELILFHDPLGADVTIRKSELEGMSGELKKAFQAALDDPNTKRRKIQGHKVKWVKIAGNEIVEKKDWAGSTIPLAFCLGEKTRVDGELDIKGHTRALIDPQNTYNYYASAGVEFTALQGKTPWLTPVAAIGDLDSYWGRQNLDNLSFLPWNHIDDKGKEIPSPERIAPPNGASAYQNGMETAAQDMMMVSGQYQPMMGEPSNERSGKAIQARQRQGENSTYHFIDSQATMLRRVGKIIIELIPKIYDTPRIIKIMGEDGSDSDVWLDPDAKQGYAKQKAQDQDAADKIIFNPSIGRYDVVSDPGPDFATRRQEAFQALSEIAAQNPRLMEIIGDLVLLAADFPMAEEAAERIRRMVPPQALGEAPDPATVEAQKQLSAANGVVASMSAKLQELQAKMTDRDAQKGIDLMKAVTQRLDVLMKYGGVPASELLRFQHDLAMQEHAGNLTLASKAVDASLQSDVGIGEGPTP